MTTPDLPPVGTICRVSHQQPHIPVKDGAEVTIIAHDGDLAIFRVNDWNGEGATYHGLVARCLVPVPTAEQIAVDELCETITGHYGSPKMSEHYLRLARALYDAGYRKLAPEAAQ